MSNFVNGFSKKNKLEKIDWIIKTHFHNNKKAKHLLFSYLNNDESIQNLHDEFIENTISNFYLPFAVAPNFLINGKYYTIPMAIEESSVVAAVSKTAKFWANLGGFKTKILGVEKVGQIHFFYNGSFKKLKSFFKKITKNIIKDLKPITSNMEKRGGGISSIELADMSQKINSYYQKSNSKIQSLPNSDLTDQNNFHHPFKGTQGPQIQHSFNPPGGIQSIISKAPHSVHRKKL